MSNRTVQPTPPVALALTLPLPPGVNNQYLTIGRRRVLSRPAQAFHRDVARLIERGRRAGAVSQAVEAGLRASLIGAYLTFFFETPHRRDLDGGLKIALDALARALGFDDRAIVDLHLTKRIDPLRPRLEVELEAISDWEFDRAYVYLGDPPSETAQSSATSGGADGRGVGAAGEHSAAVRGCAGEDAG